MAFQQVTSSVTDNFDKENKRKGYRFGDSPFLFLICKANISSHKVTYGVGTSANISSAIAHIDSIGGSAGVLVKPPPYVADFVFAREGRPLPYEIEISFCICLGILFAGGSKPPPYKI